MSNFGIAKGSGDHCTCEYSSTEFCIHMQLWASKWEINDF